MANAKSPDKAKGNANKSLRAEIEEHAHKHGYSIKSIPEIGGPAFEHKGFCAALFDGLNSRHMYSDNLEDFVEFIKANSISWVDFVVGDFETDASRTALSLGFSEGLLNSILKNTLSGYEDFGNEMAVIMPAILVRGFDVKLDPLLVLIRENLIVTIHSTEAKRFTRMRRYAEIFMKKLPQKMEDRGKITMILVRLIDENNARNFDHLQEIEAVGDKMSAELADPKTPREKLGIEIYKMKHALIVYLNGMWAIIDALNSLRYGDADLITDDEKILGRIGVLINEVNIHISLTEHLSEVLASGLEVVQSIYNNQLQVVNNRLAMLVGILTIVGTALIVPNTIATVASNQMFKFTENDIGWYLALIVLSTVVSTIFAWWAMNRLGFFPKSPE